MLGESKSFGASRDSLTVSMLADHQYRDYLREKLFLLSARDPMTLVSALRPGRREEWRLTRSGWYWGSICTHRSLRDFRFTHRRHLKRRVVVGPLGPAVGADAQAGLDVDGEEQRKDLGRGPPASWLSGAADMTAARWAVP